MKKILSFIAVITAVALSLSDAKAQTKTAIQNTALLYEVTGKNLKKPSYLFGTIHLMCEKDMFPAGTLQTYVGQTEQLILEINLNDQAEMLTAAKGMRLADGKNFKDDLTPEQYARLDEVFKDYMGIPVANLLTIKPVMLSTMLTTSPKSLGCKAVGGYDKSLADAAVVNKMPIVALETTASQIAVLDAQPLDQQVKTLNLVASDPEKSFEDFRKLYQIYLTQNTDELYKITEQQFKAENQSQDILLNNRNRSWIPIIEKNISEKPSFIAVGGGHLGGENGVINLLRKQGYTLKPIKL